MQSRSLDVLVKKKKGYLSRRFFPFLVFGIFNLRCYRFYAKSVGLCGRQQK